MKPPKSGHLCGICHRAMLDPTWYWHPTYGEHLHFTYLHNREVGIPTVPLCEPCRTRLVSGDVTADISADKAMVDGKEIVYGEYAYYMRRHVEQTTL